MKSSRAKRRRGASHSDTDFNTQLRTYYSHHLQVLHESWQQLWRTPFATLLTWILVGVALALPCAMYVALGNMEQLRDDWRGGAQLSVFLQDSLSIKEGRGLSAQLAQREIVSSSEFISSSKALEEFKALSGMSSLIDSLGDNPLPASIVLVLDESSANLVQHSESLRRELEAMPGVDEVVLDQRWLQRLQGIMLVGQRFTWVVAILLAFAVLSVIGNTIRLSIENRREEIQVLKLVGGTDAYVQRPFLYFGLLFGLGGGLACLLILLAIYGWLIPVFSELVASYGSQFQLRGLGFVDAILMLGVAGVLGVLGAWLAVNRQLRMIDPV